jgi:hypothetical protein
MGQKNQKVVVWRAIRRKVVVWGAKMYLTQNNIMYNKYLIILYINNIIPQIFSYNNIKDIIILTNSPNI